MKCAARNIFTETLQHPEYDDYVNVHFWHSYKRTNGGRVSYCGGFSTCHKDKVEEEIKDFVDKYYLSGYVIKELKEIRDEVYAVSGKERDGVQWQYRWKDKE